MANQTHLSQLKEGVGSWNAWRERNPKIIPDLSGADLSKINLAKVNFSKANLVNVDFTGTVLTDADFSGASMGGAMGLTWQG